MAKQRPTEKQLRKLYYEDKMTQEEIAKHLDYSRRSIVKYFKKYGIEVDYSQFSDRAGPKTEEGKNKVTQNLVPIDELKEKGVWQLSEQGRRAKQIAMHMNNMKNGLYASIPIRCKGDNCPYIDSCPIYRLGEAPVGELCPVEISTIEQLAEKYIEELEIEPSDMIDISMIRDVVDMDISIMRCNKKLATDADIVQQVIVGVNEDGDPFRKPEVHKAYELQMRLIKQRRKLLEDLHGTRKEKAKDDRSKSFDISEYIAKLRKRAENANSETIDVGNIVEDVEIEEINEDDELQQKEG